MSDDICEYAEIGSPVCPVAAERNHLLRELAEAREAAIADRLVVNEAYRNEKEAKAALAEATASKEAYASIAAARWNELAEAREFIAAIFDATDWPEGGDLDVFNFQALAVKHRLLIPREAVEPCNIGCEETRACHCAEYGDFPQTCYRMVDWLIDLHAKGEGER